MRPKTKVSRENEVLPVENVILVDGLESVDGWSAEEQYILTKLIYNTIADSHTQARPYSQRNYTIRKYVPKYMFMV